MTYKTNTRIIYTIFIIHSSYLLHAAYFPRVILIPNSTWLRDMQYFLRGGRLIRGVGTLSSADVPYIDSSRVCSTTYYPGRVFCVLFFLCLQILWDLMRTLAQYYCVPLLLAGPFIAPFGCLNLEVCVRSDNWKLSLVYASTVVVHWLFLHHRDPNYRSQPLRALTILCVRIYPRTFN